MKLLYNLRNSMTDVIPCTISEFKELLWEDEFNKFYMYIESLLVEASKHKRVIKGITTDICIKPDKCSLPYNQVDFYWIKVNFITYVII